MSESAIILRSILVLLPPLVAGLGGFLVLSSRTSRSFARGAQLLTASFLLTLAIAGYWNGLPRWYWSLELAVVVPCLIAFLSTQPIVKKIFGQLRVPRRWDLALLGVSPLVLLLGYWQISAMTEVEPFDLLDTQHPSLEHEKAKEVAFTDRQRPIPLFELKPDSKENFSISGDQGLSLSGTPMPYKAVRLTEASGSSNCIGWVFVAGRYEMQCKDVDTILEDNGYKPVQSPHVGDLIVYRDSNKEVIHAGTVAFLLSEDQPMIDSKWGMQGVFLHLPDGAPFGTDWTYYRSPRANKHLLATSMTSTPPDSIADSVP